MSKQVKAKPRMKPQVKKMWVDLLRSKRFTQYVGSLRNWNTMESPSRCCLGVLCEVRSKIAHKNVWKLDHIVETHDGLLGENMLNWAGLPDTVQLDLSKMNDDGSSFEEIADYIDKEL
jgi:hypothetical protein